MDIKLLKQELCVNEVIYNETATVNIDTDFTLPDYCPAIARVLKCRAIPRISSKSVNGQSFTVDGHLCINVIYCDEENCVNNYEYLIPFTNTFEVGNAIDNAVSNCTVAFEYINCRAVSERKLDIRSAVNIFVKLLSKKTSNIISDIDEKTIEKKTGILPAVNQIGNAEKCIAVEEEIGLGQGQPSLKCLIRYDGDAAVTEMKLINNKVLLKGELKICALYCAVETRGYQTVRSTVPFSQIIDIPGIDENCKCDCDICLNFLEIKPKANTEGEYRSLFLNAKVTVTLESYCKNEVPIILDAYSLQNEVNIKKDNVLSDRITENISETGMLVKTLEFPEGSIGNIIDLWCDIQNSSAKIVKSQLSVNSNMLISAIVYDADGNVNYLEKSIDEEYKKELLQVVSENSYCETKINVINTGYTILSNSTLEIRVEYGILGCVHEKIQTDLLSDLSIDNDRIKEKNGDRALVIYYADEGEDIWKIAKKYNSSMQEIININNITDNIIQGSMPLIIPVK